MLAPTYEVPGVDAYKLPPSPDGGITSPYGATVYVPGHVEPPTADALPEASWDNGLLSAWHPNVSGRKLSIPAKGQDTTVLDAKGRSMVKPGGPASIDVSVGQSYQIRAVGMEAAGSQHMLTPNGQPVTQVNYEYQYEVRKKTNVIVNEINFPSDSDWKRVSADEVANLVRDNGVASANVPGRGGI